jgi:hypothetical protein
MAYGMPDLEISWDGGKTWVFYANSVGPDCLARVVMPDGTVLWKGHAEEYLETCGGCDGSGKSRRLRFVKEPGEE